MRQTEIHARLVQSLEADEVILGEWTDNIVGRILWLSLPLVIVAWLFIVAMGVIARAPGSNIEEVERVARALAYARIGAVILGLMALVLLVAAKPFADGSRRAFLMLTSHRVIWVPGTRRAKCAVYVSRADVLQIGYCPGAGYLVLSAERRAFAIATHDRWSAHEIVRLLSSSWRLPVACIDLRKRMALMFRRHYGGVHVKALCIGGHAAVLDLRVGHVGESRSSGNTNSENTPQDQPTDDDPAPDAPAPPTGD